MVAITRPNDESFVERPIEQSGVEEKVEEPKAKKSPRLTSLDAFRGATVALMLLVNNLALDEATPKPLVHAPFGQWASLADLVFPWFLLCAGLSLPFSYRSAVRRGVSYGAWVRKAVTRAIGLLVLGMVLDSAIMHEATYGLGVLQLIGLASLVAALLIPLRPVGRGLVAAGLLAAYGAALALIPVPTVGRQVISEHVNLVNYINDVYFLHLGLRGLPSVIPTSALVIIGSIVGGALATAHHRWRVMFAGLLVTAAGAAWFMMGHPMSKEIWTPPYILFAGGIGTAIVAILAYLLDGRPWAKIAEPLNVFGANPLVAYAGPILVKCLLLQVIVLSDGKTIQQDWVAAMQTRFGHDNGGWIYTLSYMALTWAILAWMRQRNVTLKM